MELSPGHLISTSSPVKLKARNTIPNNMTTTYTTPAANAHLHIAFLQYTSLFNNTIARLSDCVYD